MTFLAVTTFNEAGRVKYGQRMMESFHAHWPDEIGLRVYAEGWDQSCSFATIVDLLEASDWLSNFKARHAHRQPDHYRMDAVRFSHKIAALIAADESMSSRYLVWMDGDIVTHSSVMMNVLETWVPSSGEWIAWLDRQNIHPECGFYIIDRDHPRHKEMMQRLRTMYDGDKLFLEKEWHDSYVLQQCVAQAGIPWKSLSGPIARRTHHPFINSVLGGYMDHMKGKRKEKGRSLRTDLRVRRQEAYWK
jgi:hypothetical protein